ncbi:MAG: hypothetical protein LH480_13950 [Rubrivivax sp.]|nr:hypothetical protein [Rubrivivax sp.]
MFSDPHDSRYPGRPADPALVQTLEKTVLWLALAVVLVGTARQVARTHQRTLGRRAATKNVTPPPRVQTWEDEGGRPDPEPADA